MAWFLSNSTVNTYIRHTRVMQVITKTRMLTLKMVHKYGQEYTCMCPKYVDICPNNCIAYTGPYTSLTVCLGNLKAQ
ncbi:hypothetical protein BDN71DRAFT_1344791, partial [Pleurotus eryngii]